MAEVKSVSLGAGTIIIGLLAGFVLSSVLKSPEVPNGSAIASGNVVMVTMNKSNSSVNPYPSIVIDSGAVETWPGGQGVPGGGVRLTASGSRDYVASVLVPTTYASGAVLHSVSLECGNTKRTLSGSIIANQKFLKQPITTGVSLRNGIFLGTGAYVYANTGTTIQTKLTAGTYLSYITINSGATMITGGSVPDCTFQPTLAEKYGR